MKLLIYSENNSRIIISVVISSPSQLSSIFERQSLLINIKGKAVYSRAFVKLLQKFRRNFLNILDSRMKLSLGMRQRGIETLLAPSPPVSHYSHHSQSPSDTATVMIIMRHGGRQSPKYYIYIDFDVVPHTMTKMHSMQ